MSKQVNLAVVGATSLVGEALIELLQEHDFPIADFFPLDGEDEAGGRVEYNKQQHLVADVESFDFSRASLVIFAGKTSLSEKYLVRAREAGCFVIDRSPLFRNETDSALVVAGINDQLVNSCQLVSSPCCIAIQLAKLLLPIQQLAGINSLTVTTYQAVSGAGKEGLEEVGLQTAALLNFKEMKTHVFPRQIAFNVIPQIGAFTESGYTLEEVKIIDETRRLLGDDALAIDVTSARVPVFYGHSVSVSVKTHDVIKLDELRHKLAEVGGLVITDTDDFNEYPTPVSEAAGQDNIYLGRLRRHLGDEKGLSCWLTADNIRACSATNLLQIAQSWLQKG